jgi:hypothetical protein
MSNTRAFNAMVEKRRRHRVQELEEVETINRRGKRKIVLQAAPSTPKRPRQGTIITGRPQSGSISQATKVEKIRKARKRKARVITCPCGASTSIPHSTNLTT